MVTVLLRDTVWVLIVNVALVAPLGTVTFAGTLATEVLLLDSDTSAPPAGAGPVSVTVPVEGLPPTTLDGFTVRELNPAATGVTVRGAVRVTPPYTAEIVTAVDPDTDNRRHRERGATGPGRHRHARGNRGRRRVVAA